MNAPNPVVKPLYTIIPRVQKLAIRKNVSLYFIKKSNIRIASKLVYPRYTLG